VTGWGVLFVLFFAVWLPIIWVREPTTNVADELQLIQRGVNRGSQWFQLADEDNPTGFGCARCHGPNAEGGQVAFQGQAYPVPSLNNVCGRLTIEGAGQIRETIMQGREGTPMPSWSVRFEGAMNDQQIQDLINYLVSIQVIPEKENFCLNPSLAEEQAEGG
jgi:cytochrome c553